MIVLKRHWGEIAVLWLVTGLCATITLFFFGVGANALLNKSEPDTAFIMALGGGFMLLIALYLLEETLTRGGVRIAIDADSVHLRLPSRRGHVRFAAINETIAKSAIVGIESRTETFSGAAMQNTYKLVLADGRRIALGSDKQMLEPFFHHAADALSADLKLPIRHLGVVKAKSGFLLIWGAAVPPWDSEALGAAEAEKTLRHTHNFLAYTRLIVLAALALSVMARTLR